jgi:uracil-DNA glycosylase
MDRQVELKMEINKYQRKLWKEYKQAIGLPANYSYLYGNPVKVHVPVDTAVNGLMVIGAYPTAHFNVIGRHRDVPVSDHLYPFSNEKYFDGSSVNGVKSGKEIEEYFLNHLGFHRDQCWITDLVKVFLFKQGHIDRYDALGFKGHQQTRSRFKELGEKSKVFIDTEVLLAQPKIILGLGAEVNSILLRLSNSATVQLMSEAKPVEYKVNDLGFKYVPVPHPGILMRGSEGAIKWRAILDKAIENIKEILQ